MQTQRAPRLQLTLTLTIAFALVFTGLCMYRYLVGVYEDHWSSASSSSGFSTSRWAQWKPHHAPGYPRDKTEAEGWPAGHAYPVRLAPIIESQPYLEHVHPETETHQSHAWFTVPADHDELELEVLLHLLSQDRHASGVVHCAGEAQSAGDTTDNLDAEVEAFYESEEEEAPQPNTRTICPLRRSQGQYDIGVFLNCAALVPARIIASDRRLVQEEVALHDPVEQAQPRRVTSRIVGRDVHLVREDVAG